MADDQEPTSVDSNEPAAADAQEQAKPRMSFLPKLLLWSLVLLFGYLYLGSLERQAGEPFMPFTMGGGQSPEAPAPSAAPATASVPTAARPQTAQSQPVEPTAQPRVAGSSASPSANTQDVSEQEAVAFAKAVMTKQAESMVAPLQKPAAAQQAPAQTAASAPTAIATPSAPAAAAPAQQAQTPAATEAAPANSPGRPAVAADAPASAEGWAAQRRVEAEAFYAERRRQAEEAARQHWDAMRRMQQPAPWQAAPAGATPYGAYRPRQAQPAPGYYPSPQAPRGAPSAN